jgi:hypothetical protein
MGLPFRSGDIVATRRFPATSIGRGYSSVWYRNPEGEWSFFADAAPDQSCTRYFGEAATRAVRCPVLFDWTDEDRLRVEVPDEGLSCEITVGSELASRVMNAMASSMPERAWASPRVLETMSRMAGQMLRAGRLGMAGRVPNGQWFIANPRRIWVVRSARLRVGEREASEIGPIEPQARLGDFFIPQRGLVAIGNAAFETFDASRHSSAVCAGGGA